MTSMRTERDCLVAKEFEEYYTSFDPDTDRLLTLLRDRFPETDRSRSSYECKAEFYELLARECRIHLFLRSGFFFEISSGRGRFTWGGLQSPVGSFFHERTAPLWLDAYGEETAPDREQGYLYNWNNPVGFDHHCPGYDLILKTGFRGIIRQAEAALSTCREERKRSFYRSVIRADSALLLLAERFSQMACRLAGEASGPKEQAHYLRIADAAARVPAEPPRTFYEGLCAVVFCREVIGSLDGIGISTFGHLDRMLYPLYRSDLESGRMTREDAMRLISDLLLYTDVRFDTEHVFRETSTTIELGGCDRDGTLLENDLTMLILQAVRRVRSVNTKINCRISLGHSPAYLREIALVQAENLPTLMMHNDDVLIPARVRQGEAVEDARLYVGGGCHEIVLEGTEVCTRADTWISLPRLVLDAMEGSRDAAEYEVFYRCFLDTVQAYHERITGAKNRQEAHWCEFDPLPLYSSTFASSLEKGLDVTEGGAKYNTTTLSMTGTATMIDSLYAVKVLVFEERSLSMNHFLNILNSDFRDEEALRQRILHRFPKHGTGDAALDRFSAAVLEDLSRVSGQPNARGGRYMPAFYPHDIFRILGEHLGATPDGRPAGAPLSRGVSPSEFISTRSPLDLVHSLAPIDFTAFADSFCAELTLPRMEDLEQAVSILCAIVYAFLKAGGSSLQFNLLDRDTLLAAREHPERYPNLTVRVCGYSARFMTLAPEVRQEIVDRAIR